MKYIKALLLSIILTVTIVFTQTGCAVRPIAYEENYKGDKILYNAEKLSNDGYTTLQKFVKWEETYRAVLPVEVSRSADVVRKNGRKWFEILDSAHDAYQANPITANKDKLTVALDLINAAIDEAWKYQIAHKRIAPNDAVARK